MPAPSPSALPGAVSATAAASGAISAGEVDFLSRPRYSQAVYTGRVRHFFSVIDPRTLLCSKQQINDAVDLLQRYKNGQREGVTQEQIWNARKIKDACVHPDTGEIIFAPVRFSAFVPTNIPLVIGMLSSSSPLSTIFWQWGNQSYNVAVNYANRNIGGEAMSSSAIAASYAGAVVASCSLALGLGHWVNKLNAQPSAGFGVRVLRGAVPFVSVASAGVVNVALMRRKEATDGIPVKDAEGNERGISIRAGKQAVTEVALTRVALPAPILLFPPALMAIWDRTFGKSRPTWRPIVQVPVITACLWLALPLAIGLFPQESAVPAAKLEPQFHNLTDSKGNKIDTFYFNKGL